MPFIYHSQNLDHQIHDEKGKTIAQFTPAPEADPKRGIFPARGELVTEDKKLAQILEALKDHGIDRAAGSEDPSTPAKAEPPSK